MEGKLVYDGFVKVKEVPVHIKGKDCIYNEICVKNAVAAIMIDENEKIGLVTQYRPLANRYTKEIVGETMDKEGLSEIEVLLQGLEEEAGIDRSEVLYVSDRPLFQYEMMIGCSNSKIDIFEIHVKEQENKEVNDLQVEYIEWITLDELKKLVGMGEIKDSKTLLAYYYLALKKAESMISENEEEDIVYEEAKIIKKK